MSYSIMIAIRHEEADAANTVLPLMGQYYGNFQEQRYQEKLKNMVLTPCSLR